MTSQVWLLVLTAAVGHALWNFAARRTAGNLTAMWLALAGGCIWLLPAILFLLATRAPAALVAAGGYRCVLATGLIHAAYFALLARAYAQGEISLVYPVARGSGIGLTALLAWFLLDESITPAGAAGIGVVLIGILTMGTPALRRGGTTRGFGTALGVGVTIVAYSLVDKVGVGRVHPVLYIWALALITVIILAPFILVGRRHLIWPTVARYWHGITVMAFGILGTYLLILFAFTMGPVSYIVAARESAVVLGSILGFVFLHERPRALRLAAIACITAGLVLIRMG